MKRAAVYVRVSTEEQTTANQLPELLQLARARGLEPVVFEETESGAKARPVLEGVLRDARQFSAVIVWALDRLGRGGALEALGIVHRLDLAGVPVISARESWLDTTRDNPFRDVLISFVATVAKMERARLIERTKAGIQRARVQGTESGKPIGRPSCDGVLLRGGIEKVAAGKCSIATAALAAGCSERTFRRALKARGFVFDGRGGVIPGSGTKPPPPPA